MDQSINQTTIPPTAKLLEYAYINLYHTIALLFLK